MGVLRWENPEPTVDPRRAEWMEVAAELRERPQVWAVVAEVKASSVTVAQGIKKAAGVYDPFGPAGTFEAKSRTIRPGVVAIYARYVGEVTS